MPPNDPPSCLEPLAGPWPAPTRRENKDAGYFGPLEGAKVSRITGEGSVLSHGATAAGSQGAERPGRPAPHSGPDPGHRAEPLLNPTDFSEGLSSVYLLSLAVLVSVHRACS